MSDKAVATITITAEFEEPPSIEEVQAIVEDLRGLSRITYAKLKFTKECEFDLK